MVPAAIQPTHNSPPETAQRQGLQFNRTLFAKQNLGLGTVLGRDERDGWLQRQAHMPRPVIGHKPEDNLRSGGCVAPVAGQQKPVLLFTQPATSTAPLILTKCPQRPAWQGGYCASRRQRLCILNHNTPFWCIGTAPSGLSNSEAGEKYTFGPYTRSNPA